MHSFDAARRAGQTLTVEGEKAEPLSLVVLGRDSKGGHQYKVIFKSKVGEIDHVFTVIDHGGTRVISWKYGSCEATMKRRRWVITDPEADELFDSILYLHHARFYEYADDSVSCERDTMKSPLR